MPALPPHHPTTAPLPRLSNRAQGLSLEPPRPGGGGGHSSSTFGVGGKPRPGASGAGNYPAGPPSALRPAYAAAAAAEEDGVLGESRQELAHIRQLWVWSRGGMEEGGGRTQGLVGAWVVMYMRVCAASVCALTFARTCARAFAALHTPGRLHPFPLPPTSS